MNEKQILTLQRQLARAERELRYAGAMAGFLGTDAWQLVIEPTLLAEEEAALHRFLHEDSPDQFVLGEIRGWMRAMRRLRELPKMKSDGIAGLQKEVQRLTQTLQKAEPRRGVASGEGQEPQPRGEA